MERTITAILTNSNDKKVFTSNATTLGELKAEMDAQGINYEGMDFMEGLTHTTMMDDNAILPSNVQYKGQTTNNLVFMLSTSNKNIKSGADRIELYAFIKSHNLQDDVERRYHTNYTRCSNDMLENFISEWCNAPKSAHTDDPLKEYLLGHLNACIEALQGHTCCSNKVESPYSNEELDEIINGLN